MPSNMSACIAKFASKNECYRIIIALSSSAQRWLWMSTTRIPHPASAWGALETRPQKFRQQEFFHGVAQIRNFMLPPSLCRFFSFFFLFYRCAVLAFYGSLRHHKSCSAQVSHKLHQTKYIFF